MRHDQKKEGEKDGKEGKEAKATSATKAIAEQAEAAKSINQLSKQELEDLLKKVGWEEIRPNGIRGPTFVFLYFCSNDFVVLL